MFSALKCVCANNNLKISTWGPVINIQDLFPASVTVSGKEVLASPIRLVAGFGGKTENWIEHSGYFTENSGERIEYLGQAIACNNVRLNLRLRVEKDGLMWYDIMLLPQTGLGMYYGETDWVKAEDVPPRLDSLTLEIPISLQQAELFHFWPRTDGANVMNSGFIPQNTLALPFRPNIWLGNETAGMAFYAESDENWLSADKNRVITIDREGDAAVLRVHLLDAMPERWSKLMALGQHPLVPIKFSFGFQATPVKPYEKKHGFERDFMQAWEKIPTNEQELDAHLQEVAEKGAKWYSVFEGWSLLQNYGWPVDEKIVRAFVKKVHEHGMRTIPYFGYEYASAAPNFFDDADTFVNKNAEGNYVACWHMTPHQLDCIVCYKSGYSQVMIDRCINAMDAYGFDGVYLDGTIVPNACANAAHGCGYTDLDGNRHETYPLLAYRQHIKKLYEAVHARGGIVEAHQSSCCIPMLMAYCDSYFDGEHLVLKPGEKISQALDIGAMRAEFTGFNWGVPIQFCLTEELMHAKPEDCFGMLMLYGVDIKAYGDIDKLVLGKYWNIMDTFDTANSVFYPCWRDDNPIRVSGEEMFCAAWVKDNRVLVLAVNLGDTPTEAELTCEKPVTKVVLHGVEGNGLKFTAQPRELYFAEFQYI